MNGRKRLPKGWRWAKLKDVGDVSTGNTPPKKNDEYYGGEVPWVRPPDLDQEEPIIETEQQLTLDGASKARVLPDNAVMVSCIGTLGKVGILGRPGTTNQQINSIVFGPEVLAEFGLFLCRTLKDQLERLSGNSTVKIVKKSLFEQIEAPLPPLAVQERIVEMLQQADMIRRKRAEARRLADQILPAVFHKMFGDPTKSKNLGKLGDIIESINNGITRRRKTPGNAGTIVLRIQDVGDGYIDFDNINRIDLTEKEKKSFLLQEGDMLLVRVNGNRELVGRNSLFQSHFEPVGHNDHLMRIRFDREKVIPEYVSAFLRTPFGRHELGMKVATSAGNHTINQNGIRNILIPLPDRPEQKKFLHIVQFIFDRQKTSSDSITHSHSIFNSLLNRALTGELTAEWEAANADWIVERQTFYERLPRLALLSLLLEQRRRAGRKAVTLITALMKYAFLSQMEGELHRRLYRFVPYHSGPWALELFNDLKALQADGLVVVENDAEEDKTRITLTDPARATALLAEEAMKDDARLAALENAGEDTKTAADPAMSRLLKRRAETIETIRTDAATIFDTYGNLDHSSLLKMVCEKYPAYAKNSRVRKSRELTSGK